ncbi:MAG TPA: hypothetical protein VF412_14310 [Bdellovibrio sp.]|uniref:COG4315 family predicted lipoprotein n=1 Tax=Bdellovibrio sp. TaxID=28201 RepID=UPI002F13BABB
MGLMQQTLAVSILLSSMPLLALADDATPPDPPAPIPLTTETENSEGVSIVADTFGRTLYVFDKDLNQSAPTCEAACAEIWAPYIINNDEAARVQAPLGKISRNSNRIQLTYKGRPVYTYAYDRQRGDDMGDLVGNVWHMILANTEDSN